MGCKGCKKSKKNFKHRIRKAKKKALRARKAKDAALQVKAPEPIVATEIPEVIAVPKKKKKKKKKRGISKRGLWLRAERRKARKASPKEKAE